MNRLSGLYKLLDNSCLDGLLLSNPANISYLCCFRSRDAYLLVSRKGNIYISDFRYRQEAKEFLAKDFSFREVNGSVFKIIAQEISALKLDKVGFEERNLPFAEHKKICEDLGRSAELIPTHNLVESLRQIKDKDELAKIRKATQIASDTLRYLPKILKPGIRELEVAAEIERFIRYKGAYAASFDTIVASGANSAFPHYLSGKRKLVEDEPVLIDMGVDYQGYKSDLTRVFFLGKIPVLARKIYNIVKQAQEMAIKMIKPGVEIRRVDEASRQYISKRGFGSFFGHSLGHGLGLEVHEGPSVSGNVKEKLKSGMVFTIEPAIYIPNKFGIRLEDMVLVTPKGAEVLSGTLNK